MAAPAVDALLPDLARFVVDTHEALRAGRLTSEAFTDRCDRFFTSERMAAIDAVVPGWRRMASFAGGTTLRHTMAALVSLHELVEYTAAAPADRDVMEWAVLLHDLAKEPAGGRDHRHAFRSAAHAARVLPALGFTASPAWEAEVDGWSGSTAAAHRFDPDLGTDVQDNTKLPEILEGAGRLLGPEAALIVKAIALHLAITVTPEWPSPAPLTSDQERRYLDGDLLPVLLVVMLADHGGWNLFDSELLSEMIRTTREVFARLG